MFVFPLVEKEFSNVIVADVTLQAGAQTVRNTTQQNQTVVEGKSPVNRALIKVVNGKQTNNQYKKELFPKNTYVEEPLVKDKSWNIYTGNPGFYVTKGDTVNFGTVSSLPDSVFLQARHTVVPKTEKPYGIVGKELVVPNQDWILGLILVLWIIFASVRVGFLKYLGQLFVSLVSFSAATRLYQERGYKTMYGALRLDLIFHLVLPLSAFQIARYYNIDIPGYPAILFFLALLFIINAYLFIKILLFQLGGSIVMLKTQTEESVFNIRLYYKALGLFLLPLVTVHGLNDDTNFITIWVMAGLILIMYVSALIRSIYVGIRKDVSIFYLILYLCTLEILPLLLIFKLMSSE